MRLEDLIIGEVYFSLAFVDPPGTGKPIITTYEFVEEATVENELRYVFKLHPHYEQYDEDGVKVAPQKELFYKTPRSTRALLTLQELIVALQKKADGRT